MLSLGLTACAPKGSPVVDGSRELEAQDPQKEKDWPAWYPHATDIRVHPASRYIKVKDKEQKDQLQLEARIELLDQFNEPIKDVGLMKIELRMLDANGRIVQDDKGRQRGFRWERELLTAKDQSDYWDPIARAYRFGLIIKPFEQNLLEYQTVLRVTFEPAWPDQPKLPRGDSAQRPLNIRSVW